jgi:regulator of protease activity HflC (stomatin/prohibitin superfamily)
LKVNDGAGNPIEIGAVVVFRVAQPARSIFNIGGQLEEFVKIQSESALRALAGEYAYDATEAQAGMWSLRDNTEVLADRLRQSLQRSVDQAGVAVESARISHLAYAPEIAPVMLRRQQAEALMMARKKIAESAVLIAVSAVVETERGLRLPAGALSEIERFRLAGRLLVTLCGQTGVQPTLPLEG